MSRQPKFDVRSADIAAFLKVRQLGSMASAALALETTTSQISKAVGRLERQLGTRLLVRGARGVRPTTAALALASLLTNASDLLNRAKRGVTSGRQLSLAGPSYLLDSFATGFAKALPSVRWRVVQMSMAAIRAAASRGQFEVALMVGHHSMPMHWVQEKVGTLSSGLFGSPKLARSLQNGGLEALKSIPFVTPVKLIDDQWEPFEDGCPLTVAQRRPGHEVASVSLALAMAATSDQLVFGPRLAARSYIQHKRLVEVETEWEVTEPLVLAVDSERVSANELKGMRKACEALSCS